MEIQIVKQLTFRVGKGIRIQEAGSRIQVGRIQETGFFK
jgi:hypothetical protein